mgnify:CR=1 FL=1
MEDFFFIGASAIKSLQGQGMGCLKIFWVIPSFHPYTLIQYVKAIEKETALNISFVCQSFKVMINLSCQ